jgi:hypothetical protein
VVTTLSFSPRCLTASRDWLCCGGDDGNYIAVCLDESKRRMIGTSSSTADADPDARLPLDLDPSSRSILRETISTSESFMATRIPRGPLSSKTAKIGEEVVNCIELWSPNRNALPNAHTIPVAVVSNNDFTVSIVDISTSEVLEEIALPDCVNRSVLSPSGILLATICDDPFLYIHERVQPRSTGNKTREAPLWTQRLRIELPGQRQNDKNNMRGSFAAAFSVSGKYLAVATQYGVVCLFDAETIADDTVNSLIKTFTSSRPGPEAGAIRDMAFSPGPYDLLSWTESSGNFCVADMRNLCISRQLIKLNSRDEGIETVTVAERPADHVIDPRLRSFRADHSSPSASTTPDYLGAELDRRQGAESERRQLRHHLAREMLDNRRQAPLTTEDLEVLHAHGIARRQRDAANAARDTAAEASRPPRSDFVTVGSVRTRSSERLVPTTSLPPALREFVNPERSTTSIRSYINDRNHDRERRGQVELEQPRRLHMIQLAAAESALEREARNDSDEPNSLERLALARQRLSSMGSSAPYDPWADFEALYHTRFAPDSSADRSAPIRMEIEAEDRSDFANRLRRPWVPPGEQPRSAATSRDEATLILRAISRSGVVETMGCSWSGDGRIL